MDSFLTKCGIFILGVAVSKYFPANLTYLIIFLFGVLLTLLIECIIFIYYVIFTADKLNTGPSKSLHSQKPSAGEEEPAFIRSPKKLTLAKFPLERRFTMIECICSSNKFSLLISGNDKTFIELASSIKELMSNEKKYANGLIKFGEIGLLEKIKSKKSMQPWKPLRDFCLELGKKYLKEGETFSENMIQKINYVNKENKKRYKTIRMRMKISGDKFSEIGNEINKLLPKLINLQEGFKSANNDFNEAKKDLAQFETLVKKEMKVKKINNEVANIKTQISKMIEQMNNEAKVYLPKANDILIELSALERIIANQYKLFFEGWLNYCLNFCAFTSEKLDKLLIPEPAEERKSESMSLKKTVNFFKSAINKSEKIKEMKKKYSITSFFSSFKSNESQTAAFRLVEVRTEKLENKANEIIKMLNMMNSVEEEFQKDHLRVFSSWNVIKNYFIEGAMQNAKSILLGLYTDRKMLNTELHQGVSLLRDFIEKLYGLRKDALALEATDEDYEKAHIKIKEFSSSLSKVIEDIKENILKAYKTLNDSSSESINKLLKSMCLMGDFDQSPSFTQTAKEHIPQCPYYIVNINTDDQDTTLEIEPEKIGHPESAIWFNDLLTTFLSEWSYSPKFISYICRRLKKGFNKDNPDYIGEIQVKTVEIGQHAPEIKDFVQLETENDLEFYYEFDLWFRGDVRIHLEFELKWSVAAVMVNVNVVLRSFYGKMRFFYALSKNKCSWYSFAAEPAHQITLEPVIGSMNKIALSKIPQINTIFNSLLTKKMRKYVWPNKRAIKIFKGNRSAVPLK